MSQLSHRKRLKYQILRFLLDREHAGPELPELTEIAEHLGLPVQVVSDQIDILGAEGAIRASRTIDGGASPMLTGSGKAMLEDLDEEAWGSGARYEFLERDRPATSSPDFEWDAFISHASEDKEPFVRQLADELQSHGARVWFDEFELKVGDSLRGSIDRGLAGSRYGIVVLSRRFFQKHWPQRELDGLAARERDRVKIILPVWLGVEKEDVVRHSPLLADLVAVRATSGMDEVVRGLLRVLKPDLDIEERIGNRESRAARLDAEENVKSKGEATKVEVTLGGSTQRPPGMNVVIKIRHVFGPPVIPDAVRLWSKVIQGEITESLQAYLEPGKSLELQVPVHESVQEETVDGVNSKVAWPIDTAPDDLWIFFTYYTLDGAEHEVARTFELSRPSNNNLFDLGRPTSQMKSR